MEARASDLHLTAGVPPKIRVDGVLCPLDEPVLTPADTARLAFSTFNAYHKERFENTWDLDLPYASPGLGRFRVNVYRQRGSVGLAARVIPEQIPSLEELNLPPILRELTGKPRGLILVTGPTGHGKSTTLAAMIDCMNRERDWHIVTIEDPIEYVFRHRKSTVNQRELGNDTRSFPTALRAVLREDPNVIVVGEMRDLETIATTLTIAETGHLILATLHTTNAVQSIDRMIDVFPSGQQQQIRVQLGGVLEAVLSQQLLPRLDGSAAGRTAKQAPGDGEAGAFARAVERRAVARRVMEVAGRVPAMEIMVATPAIRNLIREGRTHQIPSAIQTGAQFGMQTMDQSLCALLKRGMISFEAAVSRAINPEEFRKMAGVPERPAGQGWKQGEPMRLAAAGD